MEIYIVYCNDIHSDDNDSWVDKKAESYYASKQGAINRINLLVSKLTNGINNFLDENDEDKIKYFYEIVILNN